jgi:hypothetical protein
MFERQAGRGRNEVAAQLVEHWEFEAGLLYSVTYQVREQAYSGYQGVGFSNSSQSKQPREIHLFFNTQ